MLEDGLSANPAMLAEVLATRALVLAVTDQGNAATQAAVEAAAMTTAVEVHALVACVHAVIDDSQEAALAAFETAQRLDVWDPLLCASRASPRLLQRLGSVETHLPRLRTLLLQGRDFDLARYAGIDLGPRRRSRSTRLTSRESDVLELIRQGLTNGQIAQTLYISEATVKVHVRHILEKVGARTRTEAATREFDD
jgi:DNA-binding NarL/FixJ family response regulator